MINALSYVAWNVNYLIDFDLSKVHALITHNSRTYIFWRQYSKCHHHLDILTCHLTLKKSHWFLSWICHKHIFLSDFTRQKAWQDCKYPLQCYAKNQRFLTNFDHETIGRLLAFESRPCWNFPSKELPLEKWQQRRLHNSITFWCFVFWMRCCFEFHLNDTYKPVLSLVPLDRP